MASSPEAGAEDARLARVQQQTADVTAVMQQNISARRAFGLTKIARSHSCCCVRAARASCCARSRSTAGGGGEQSGPASGPTSCALVLPVTRPCVAAGTITQVLPIEQAAQVAHDVPVMDAQLDSLLPGRGARLGMSRTDMRSLVSRCGSW